MSPKEQKPSALPNVQPVDANKVAVSISPNRFHVYANNVEIGITNWDVRFMFGELAPGPGTASSLEKLGSVVMSASHAKAFLLALGGSIARFEKEWGEITIPGVKKEQG